MGCMFYKGIWIIIHGWILKLIYTGKLSFTEMPTSEGRFKIWRISLCHPPPRPLNNNDQTTPSHKSTQFPNTIITWIWLKTLYEVLHAVKITTFTLMNEEIIFVSKCVCKKCTRDCTMNPKSLAIFGKKWSLYYSKLKHRKVQKSILSRRFNDLYGHQKIGANWCRLLRVSSKLPDNLGELNIYAMSQTWSVTGLIHSPIIDKKLMKLLKWKVQELKKWGKSFTCMHIYSFYFLCILYYFILFFILFF